MSRGQRVGYSRVGNADQNTARKGVTFGGQDPKNMLLQTMLRGVAEFLQ